MRVFQRTSASTRCAVWTGILLISLALPAIDYASVLSVNNVTVPAQSHRPGGVAKPIHSGTVFVQPTAIAPAALRLSLARILQRVAQAAFIFWLCGIAFFVLRFAYQTACLLAAKRAIEIIEADSFPMSIPRMRRSVRVGLSERVAVPCLLGLFDPIIALPRSLTAELSEKDLQRIVLHETAHLQRGDDWFNLLEQLALVFLFFSPALHFIARQIGVEREVACDDRVIATLQNRITYAKCLSELAHRCTVRRALTVPGVFTNRRQIRVRIERLLDREHNGSPHVGRKGVLAIATLSLAGLALSQTGIPVLAAAKVVSLHHRWQVQTGLALQRSAPTPRDVRANKEESQAARAVTEAMPLTKPAAPSKRALARRLEHSTAMRKVPVNHPAVKREPSDQGAEVIPAREQESGYADAMSLAGYTGLGADQIIELHDHGVTPGFIAEFKEAGYTGLASEQLIDLLDHGVSGSFARVMTALGGHKLEVSALIDLTDHGVSIDYVSALAANGVRGIPFDQLIELRDHGVSVEYVTSLARVGYGGLCAQDLIDLLDHGVTAAYIQHLRRDMNPFKVSVQELIRLRDSEI